MTGVVAKYYERNAGRWVSRLRWIWYGVFAGMPLVLAAMAERGGVADEQVDAVVEAIADSAASGRIGDGKIFVQPLDQAIRIRTGEEGDKAL